MPPRSKPTPAELIRLLCDNAEALRKAGVCSFEIDGLSAELAPRDIDIEALKITEQDLEEYLDPLNDPDTFPGGRVPGYKSRDDSN